MKTIIGLLALMLSGEAVFSLPVVVEKNIVIRAVEGRRAIQKGPYVLKAGSVIDIPDQFIVRNSVGDIDFPATLLNWRTGDSQNGVYSLVKGKRVVGKDVFFKLNVIEAAPGSNIPSDFTGYIALEFLARSRSLKTVTENNAPVLTDQEKADAGGKIPTPLERPVQEKATPDHSTHPTSSNMIPTESGGGSGGIGSDYVAGGGGNYPTSSATPTSKQEVLQPDNRPTKDDLLVYEKSTPNLPVKEVVPDKTGSSTSDGRDFTVHPVPKVEDAVSAMEQANSSLNDAGSSAAVCPDGKCDVALAASEAEEKMACEQIAKGDFPESLNSVRLTTSGQKTVDASLKWFSQNLKNPTHCKDSCDFNVSGIAALFNTSDKELKRLCDRIDDCGKRCQTSDIQTTWKCTSASKKRGKECIASCSPYQKLDQTHRGDHLKRLFAQVTADIEKYNLNYATKMERGGYKSNMAQRLLCMNKRRENVDLDPMARNCTSTAIGIGQVLIGTFYYGLGLANDSQQKRCLNMKIKDLATKCKGWDRNAFRKEVYWKYMDYTPKELNEMRTLDVELQARSTYATFLDKLRLKGFDLNKAYRGYFGKSDKKAINRIENCVKTGR